MTPEILARAAALLGRSIVATRPVQGGFTQAARGVLEFEDGSTAFLKAATDDLTAGWLRDEHRVYCAADLRGAGFLPRLHAWEGGPRPLLVIEDLSDGDRPPPWSSRAVAAVRATLDDLHGRAALPGPSNSMVRPCCTWTCGATIWSSAGIARSCSTGTGPAAATP